MTAFADSDAAYDYDISLLRGLEITDDTASDTVTRAMFCQYVSNIINYRMKPQNKNGRFSDMSETHPNSGAVYNLFERGYISGKSETSFDPDSPILYEQALKILLNAAGFGVLADSYGDYPVNYLRIGSEYGFTKGTAKKVGDELTTGEAAAFLSNALKQPVPVQSGFGGERSFSLDGEKTMLSEFMGIKKISGIMTDNGIASLTGSSKVREKYVKINGNELFAGENSYVSYLGCLVDAYAANDDEKKIIYLACNERNKILSVSAETILDEDKNFSINKIVYEDIKGGIKTAKISPDADFILNNSTLLDVTKKDISIDCGELILIDNNGDGINEVVLIKKPVICSVSGVDANNGKLFLSGGKAALNLRDAAFLSITKNGKIISISDISKDDVIKAYVNADEDIYEISVITRKITGAVNSVGNHGSYVEISGAMYTVLNKDLISSSMLNGVYTFLLDDEGKIVDVKAFSHSEAKVAMLRDAKVKKNLNGSLQLKLLGCDGEIFILSCAKKLMIDSDSSMSAGEAETYLCANAKNKLIKYELDINGEINEIKTAYEGKSMPDDKIGELQMYQGGEKLQYSGSQNCFGGKILISGDTKIFLIPASSDEDEKFIVSDISFFNHTSSYFIDAYTIGIENGFAEYVICKNEEEQTYTNKDNPVLVDKIVKTLSENGEVELCLKGYGVSGEVSYAVKNTDAIKDIRQGDVIRCVLDVNGKIIFAKKVYDGQTKKLVSETNGVYFSDTRSAALNVYSKFGKIISVTTLDPLTAKKEAVLKNAEYFNLGNVKVYMYDKSKSNPIEALQIDEIKAFCDTNEDFSRIYMFTYSSIPRIIVVYK